MNEITKNDLIMVAGGGNFFGKVGKIMAKANDFADKEIKKAGEKIREIKSDYQEARNEERDELLKKRRESDGQDL